MKFTITSKLTSTQRSRINRAAERYAIFESTDTGAFVKIGRNIYTPYHDVDVHNAVRHAMVIAGCAFQYRTF